MKFLILLCAAFSLLFVSITAVGKNPQNENSPWEGALNFCDSEDLSLREIRQGCEDFWSFYFDVDVIPPVVVTHCPPDHATDNAKGKGKKPWGPNSHCSEVCAEGEVEISCIAKRWED